MQIRFDKHFGKQRDKAPAKIQQQLKKRLILFFQNQFHPSLRNHPLTGKYDGCRSINITGDWRAVYTEIDQDNVLFVALGTHSQLYK